MDKVKEILKQNKINYSSLKTKAIDLKSLEEFFYHNIINIKDALDKDKKITGYEFSEDIMIKVIQENVRKQSFFKKEEELISPIGNLVILSNGDPYITIEMCIKSLITNNHILFLYDLEMIQTNKLIIDVFKTYLKEKSEDENMLNMDVISNFKDVVKLKDMVDCYIIIGDYDKYEYIKNNVGSKVIYSDYTNVNIYTDTGYFEDEIKKITIQANKRNCLVYLYKMKSIKDLLETENNNFIFHTTAIYTKNPKEAYEFLDKIKSKYIYVNKTPLEFNELDIELEDLIYKKKIIK